MPNKATPIDSIITAYEKTGSVWEAGKIVGLCGQTVHERLKRHGYVIEANRFTKDEDGLIIEAYKKAGDTQNIDLHKLAESLGRKHHTNISRRARQLGLTNQKRKRTEAQRQGISVRAKKRIKEKGHPRGALGMKHTAATKKILSDKSKEMWKNPDSKLNSKEHRQYLSDKMSKQMTERMRVGTNIAYSNAKSGWAEFNNGKRYFLRSGWELKYANYLEALLKGRAIKSWEYEVDTFWFEKIRRGVRSYTPDFKVTYNDGEIQYHEVKGYMDPKSKTKLKRMAKYYPKIIMYVVDRKEMKRLGLL